MKVEYHKHWSSCLGQEMEFKVYGQAGKPVVVFPAMGGRFYEFEDFGMVEAARPYIEADQFQLFCVDSVDWQTWINWHAHPDERARRHEDYDHYICQELVPFIQERRGAGTLLMTTGCSMGGYHAANFFFRHPDLFDTVLSLSGVFDMRLFVGDASHENIYFNSPLFYLPNLEDPWYLEKYRRSDIILCAGQGAWEEEMRAGLDALRPILEAKGIPAWIDLWGHDVDHDWPWWRRQLPYFLGKLVERWQV